MLLSSTFNNGLFQELDREAGTTVNNYSFKNKLADLNDAQDWYFPIAFKAGLNWELDDKNNTSPPIDTQDIVSGTNRYKVSAFTEKIFNLIRLEILDSSGKGHFLIPETMDTLGTPTVGATSGQISGIATDTFQERYLNAPSGLPTHYIKFGDFIYLYPKPNYNYTAGLKAYFNRPATRFSFVSVTVDASTDVFTATGHGLVAGDTVVFETDGTIPTGVTADQTYYVISSGLTSSAFKVSSTLGGSTIDVTNAQTSSNHVFLKTSAEPGITSIHHPMLARRAALKFRSLPANAGSQATLSALFAQVQKDEVDIGAYYSGRGKDIRPRMVGAFQNNH